jgi:hypothetical protein
MTEYNTWLSEQEDGGFLNLGKIYLECDALKLHESFQTTAIAT